MAGRFGAPKLSPIAHEPIDQALFGYADGHRQIASSTRLPPKDLYLLSSASDLASGTRLGMNDSYLTGLPLPESRRYALFRTWGAPEMPRPGCVWSHTLLLEQRAIASLPAFSELLVLFRRPKARESPQYAEPLELTLWPSVEAAGVRLISPVIESYYSGRQATLSSKDDNPDDIERAVLAVWSQQWPRLRAGFSFCTASLNERRRTEKYDYDVQVTSFGGSLASNSASWVSIAAADAAENRVTPLRRFLWRYGRDLANSRRHYRMLVELFERSTSSDKISAEAASTIFQSLPDPAEGAVLKRDIIGIGTSSPRLVAAVSAVDFLVLLASGALPEMPTPSQVGKRLKELTSTQIGPVARYYDGHKEELAPWRDSIVEAIIALADKPAMITGDFPPSVLAEVLTARTDLISAETLQRLTSDVLERLLREDTPQHVAEAVVSEMLRRDTDTAGDRIFAGWPAVAFRCAIEAFLSGRLSQSWLQSISRRRADILSAPWLGVLTFDRRAFRGASHIRISSESHEDGSRSVPAHL